MKQNYVDKILGLAFLFCGVFALIGMMFYMVPAELSLLATILFGLLLAVYTMLGIEYIKINKKSKKKL